MKLRNRNRAMMIFMSLMLATTGCGKKNDYEKEGFARIQEIMDNSEFYQEELFDETNEENYKPFYQNYLEKFAKYMTQEQYELFLAVVIGMSDQEEYDYVNTYSKLNDMFDITPIKEGRCFFQCFNSRVMGENILFADINKLSKMTKHITTLRAIVNNDDAFFKSVYSANIDEVIDCICKNTCYENRELVEELFFKLDLYYDLVDSDDYMDNELKDNYEARVREIISFIIEAKCNKDENFSNSLYARFLNDSNYFNKETYYVLPSLTENTFYLQVQDAEGFYRIYEIDNKYLYEDISLEEITKLKANEIIEQGMNMNIEDYHYSYVDTMKLLMSIIDVDIFNNQELPDSDAIRLAMYENLHDYFALEAEFNTFVIKLYDGNSKALERYFDILTKRIKEEGINYDDFIRYLCLVNYNNERTSTHIYFSGTYEEMKANYIPEDEVRLMKESEWDPIVYRIQENYFIGSVPYEDYFADIEKCLANNDLGYELLYNPDCEYTWGNNEANVTNLDNTQVLSSLVKAKEMEYNGTNIIYYEIPENYEQALAVETFYNIDSKFINRTVNGFKTTIEDPETGEEKFVFVSGIADSLDNAEDIRFIMDYPLFIENRRNNGVKELSLGGNHE